MRKQNTKHFGLIGRTLSYSFSEQYFTEKFEREHINAKYKLYPLTKIEDVKSLILEEALNGFNVTIPYKEKIIPLLDEISDDAKSIGAVNTVKVVNNKLIGFNTDAYGFKESLKPFLKRHHRSALIFGTGGASKAVSHVLEELGLSYIFVSRNPDGYGHKSYQELNKAAITHFPLLINTTPLGTFPDVTDKVDIPYEYISENNFLYDLVYNPEETSFLKEGMKRNAQVLNGMKMLYFQAEKAWEIWQSK